MKAAENAFQAAVRPPVVDVTKSTAKRDRVLREVLESDGENDLTDTGNARRLVAAEGSRMRWVNETKTWLIRDERNLWHTDSTRQVVRFAQATARALLLQAAECAGNVDVSRRLAQHAIKSQGRQRLNDAIELAKAEPDISISAAALDSDSRALSVLNGIVDLSTGRLRARTADDLASKCVAAKFAPDAVCPKFEAFLHEVMDDRPEMVDFLQRLIGYSLIGGNPEQVLAILVGVGANGKSTLLQVLLELFADYAQTTPAESFMTRREGAASNDLARLRGARIVSATEAEKGRRLNENLVKRLTGGDRIAVRFLFAEYFEFVPQFTAFLAVNHKPIVSGDDPAIWRRLLIIPFDRVIPPAQRDKHLVAKLLAEREGILAWAVRGCLAWQRNGLDVPKDCIAAASDYRQEMDTFGSWLDERTVQVAGVSARANQLYESYAEWCKSNGHHGLNSKAFGLTLGERGFEKTRTSSGWTYRGVGLLSDR